MTHSHDIATPALSVESEYVLVPRDQGPTFSDSTLPYDMIAAGMAILERADDDLAGRNGEDVPDWDYGMEAVAIYRAMISAAPASNPSPSAKGGDAVVVTYDDFHAAYGFVPRSKVSPDRCLKTRLRALLRAEDLAHADEAEALATPSPQPAKAVPAGDAAQEAEAYIQAAVDRAPEPLRRLGEWLSNKLDEDDWKTAERMLLGAALASDPAPAGEAVEPVGSEWEAFDRWWSQSGRKAQYDVLAQQAAFIAWCERGTHPVPEDTARLREDLERVTRERGNLAQAIGEAVIQAGICRPDAGGLTGPQLLLLLDGLVESYKATQTEREDARKALETVQEALKPFSDYADPLRTAYPDDMPMTKGSAIAARQVTAGDFRRAREAYHAAARSASREGASDE